MIKLWMCIQAILILGLFGGCSLSRSTSQNATGGRQGAKSLRRGKPTIVNDHAYALLFCSESFFCGALQVDQDLLKYSETYIQLAPLAVR